METSEGARSGLPQAVCWRRPGAAARGAPGEQAGHVRCQPLPGGQPCGPAGGTLPDLPDPTRIYPQQADGA